MEYFLTLLLENKEQATGIVLATFSGIVSALLVISIISRRKTKNSLSEINKMLSKELSKNDFLTWEVNHRVNNNLQIMASILSLQSRCIDNSALTGVMQDCKDRVHSIALIYSSLFPNINSTSPSFTNYLRKLIPELITNYRLEAKKINILLDVEEIALSFDESIPCGLIIREVIAYNLKNIPPSYGEGSIHVKMIKEQEYVSLEIADHQLLSDGLYKEKCFSCVLIETLVEQLEGKMTVDERNGLSVKIDWTPRPQPILTV
jgi:two-component sensor histidine kinase